MYAVRCRFSFSKHLQKTCKACLLQMSDLLRIRQYLTLEVAVLAANALVSSCLNYCNSLFRGLSIITSCRVFRIPLLILSLIIESMPTLHPSLMRLHSLPVKYHCMWKTATLVYNFFQFFSLLLTILVSQQLLLQYLA